VNLSTFKIRARGRPHHGKKRGEMNRMEAAWAAQLDLAVRAGDVLWYAYESLTLKLADDTRYTPDFVLMFADGSLCCDECKGFMEEAAWVRMKVAAALFPLRFRLITLKPKKEGGGWVVKELGEASDELEAA
jgi:hypothetical protein